MPQILEEKADTIELKLEPREEIVAETENLEISEKVSSGPFDYKLQYTDEYYEEYISNFEQNTKKRYFYRFVKRSFDVFASLLGLIIALPLFIVIAIAIKFDSKGPVIFKQDRIGKGGKVFKCLKFRSMKIDTPHDVATAELEHPERCYTKVGRFLRRFSLDELPQFWCVFVGKMSFIGYRPIILAETECNEMRARLGVYAMRPGISGYAQVHGRDELVYQNKAILDAEYVKHASIIFDIKLVFHTIACVLKRDGNDAEHVIPEKECAEMKK